MASENKASKLAVWVLMGLLIVGLAGFGATSLTGTLRTVGHVGDEQISVDAFAREVQQEMRAAQAQFNQPVTMDMARAIGLDQQALSRLVLVASLDGEAKDMGLSVGDETLRQEIQRISAFQGPGGQFDRDTYRLALDGIGLSESEFESDLRDESGRTILQGAVVSGISMPAEVTEAIVDFVGARRSFTWTPLDESDLTTPLPDPDDATLEVFYGGNPDLFRLPETKVITYALLSPTMILDSVEVDETTLRELYDDRRDLYDVPERRLVDRLVFSTEAEAQDALAQLEVGGTSFEQLVTDRGLSLLDVDMGDVTLGDLDDAGAAVFDADFGAVVGPFPTALGPALFRVNGIVAARQTSFEEAEPELRDQLAGDRARRVIEAQAEDINDLFAGGATLEDAANDTDMELGQINWSEEVTDGVAGYETFRQLAGAVSAEDFPEIAFLDDGSIVALRLDEILPERPEPFADAINDVANAWRATEIETRLTAQAEDVVAALSSGASFADQGLEGREEIGLTRSEFVAGAPFSLIVEVFEMEPGTARLVSGPGGVALVRLDATLPPADNDQTAQLRTTLSRQLDQQLATGLFQAFASDTQLRGNPQIDMNAVNAVLNSFQ
ncbi:MAG: SurA N-terminal domain-containing protein [Pseudomonadota bacterium]